MTPEEAIAEQERLRPLVRPWADPDLNVRYVAGLDVSYADDDRLAGAVVVLDVETLYTVDTAVVLGTADFPYLPGLFAFRELPPLVRALEKLSVTPDLLVCDGQGLAHPRRFGLACHLGVVTDLPSVGVAKTPMGRFEQPSEERGSVTDLVEDGEVVGRALRTREGVKPVFVSVGHKIDLDRACAEVLRLCVVRLPETTRRSDALGRAQLR
ncbi:endonuclease V [Actinosynnema sp. NPDC047251]|uniref:Endonuclease V n=1 Tax=Saccharothrix espanaensis (strain ATCC 51144 / DSM 44229 / JCM 9112 / NBRC 15066 / NRRL 15764) TaxID=1179773 RepID=K0JU79_SACES|nr:endonuclease V [Saccharothrix espanaensis]CCH29047.1 Endonuclease V [Saccharothrix espanaensis DSM 44229]